VIHVKVNLIKIGRLMVFCVLLAAFLFIAGCVSETNENHPAVQDPAMQNWRLTVNGTNPVVLSMQDLQEMPAVTGHGYCVSTTGIMFGPYVCKGVDLREIAALAGGMNRGDRIWVSAPDGYLWVFDSDQMEGDGFVTFNGELKEIPSPPLRIILMYEQDGRPVTYDEGGPARIAIISEEPGIVTEGSAWVKWVDRIEVKKT
jgi:DMSO/TMAO reductase YedYZ molybdopterin-dependent catalytic subunit